MMPAFQKQYIDNGKRLVVAVRIVILGLSNWKYCLVTRLFKD